MPASHRTHSFIQSIYIALFKNLLRSAPGPATTKEKRLEGLVEPCWMAQSKERSLGGRSFQMEGPTTEKASERPLEADEADNNNSVQLGSHVERK